MNEPTNQNTRLLNRFDFLTMLGAIATLFIALGTEPWWTLNGTTINSLFSIQVSPYYLRINAVGLPSTAPLADILGTLTRTIILLGFVALFAASIRPTAWWRNITLYFGLASLAELYLSFLLMYHWAETAFTAAYGVIPPYYGTTTLQANILGLDLTYYATPLVTATFTLPCYLGFASLALVLGRSVVGALQDRALQALASLLPGGGIKDIFLKPPYKTIWFNSGDKDYNPLATDPQRLNDDQLLLSFKKLYDTVEPGGSLSIILPAYEVDLEDRLDKIMPQTGFAAEPIRTIFRADGKPESELRFRKPAETPEEPVDTEELEQVLEAEQATETSGPTPSPAPTPAVTEEPTASQTIPAPATTMRESSELKMPEETPPLEQPESLPTAEESAETRPPIQEISEAQTWVGAKLTRTERAILKSAIGTIAHRQEPVAYRELLNQVYMELVDKRVEFDSARQIETTLLDHNGREIQLVEETDQTLNRTVKKWWLGNQKLPPEKVIDKVRDGRDKVSGLRRMFQRP